MHGIVQKWLMLPEAAQHTVSQPLAVKASVRTRLHPRPVSIPTCFAADLGCRIECSDRPRAELSAHRMGVPSRVLVILLAVAIAGVSPRQAFGQDWGSGIRYTNYTMYQHGQVFFNCAMAAMKWGNGRVDEITEDRTNDLQNAGFNMNALDNFQPPLPSPNPALPDNAPEPAKLILRRINALVSAFEFGMWIGAAAIVVWNKYKDYNRNTILGGIHAHYQSAIAATDQIMSDRTWACASLQNEADFAQDQGIIGNQANITVNYAIVKSGGWYHYPKRIVTKVTVTCVANC